MSAVPRGRVHGPNRRALAAGPGHRPLPRTGVAVQPTLRRQPPPRDRAKNDRVAAELVRTGAGLGTPSSQRMGVDWLEFTNADGVTAHDRFLEEISKVKISGRSLRQSLDSLVRSSSYQRLAVQGIDELDSPRAQRIKRILTRYRSRAARRVLQEYPELQNAVAQRRYQQRAQATGR